MGLTDTAVRNARAGKAKQVKLVDDRGLFLLVKPTGKFWRFRYWHEGHEGLLSLGLYPDVSLAKARKRRDEARALLADGVNPSVHRKAEKVARREARENTFEAIGGEWFAKNSPALAEKTKKKLGRFLDKDVYPQIGDREMNSIMAADVIRLIEKVENRGALDIARRVHNLVGRIFRYAVGRGLALRDPSRDIELKDILAPSNIKHHAAIIDPKAVGGLMRAIDGFEGSAVTVCALRLAPLVFVRPGELRHAEWTEFNFEKAEWRIPGPKMKMKEQHIVPLSKQAVAVLREIQRLTGEGKYVFPSVRGGGRPMSENTINAALRRMGYTTEEMTGHGFRGSASTLLHELGYPKDVIERQLAHGERNKVAAAYNFAEHLPARRKLMQEWADYLDKLKAGAKVIPLRA